MVPFSLVLNLSPNPPRSSFWLWAGAVCPELQNQVMNLELLPASLNRAKSAKATDRAKVLLRSFTMRSYFRRRGHFICN